MTKRTLSEIARRISQRLPGLVEVVNSPGMCLLLQNDLRHIVRGFSVYRGPRHTFGLAAFARLLCEPGLSPQSIDYGMSLSREKSLLDGSEEADRFLDLDVEDLAVFQERHLQQLNSFEAYKKYINGVDGFKPGPAVFPVHTLLVEVALGNFDIVLDYLRTHIGLTPMGVRRRDCLIELRQCLENRPSQVYGLLDEWEEEGVRTLKAEHFWKRERLVKTGIRRS